MARIFRVCVERRPVTKSNEQARIIRSHGSDDVEADLQLDDSADIGEPSKSLMMLCARGEIELGLVFETDHVNEH